MTKNEDKVRLQELQVTEYELKRQYSQLVAKIVAARQELGRLHEIAESLDEELDAVNDEQNRIWAAEGLRRDGKTPLDLSDMCYWIERGVVIEGMETVEQVYASLSYEEETP